MVGLQAYRALAKKLHPDKAVKQGVTKREAEKRFHDLAEAYEVGYPSSSDSTTFCAAATCFILIGALMETLH